MKHYLIGVDIGGTKIEACLLEIGHEQGAEFQPIRISDQTFFFRTLFRERVFTHREEGYRAVMARVQGITKKAAQEISNIKPARAVGIGLPGTVDPVTRKMLNGNTNIFVGEDLESDFREMFDMANVRLANDANCFALAETIAGVGLEHELSTGKKIEDLLTVGVILGTGCGTGIIYQGQMIQGRVGGTGEAGHTTLVGPNGRVCFCGRTGCAELYVSGTGIQISYKEASKGDDLSASEIFDSAKRDEPVAKSVVSEYCGYLAKFLANLTNIIDPDFFVLGGGVSQSQLIYQGLEASISGDLFLPVTSPKIYKNQLGDSAGSLGAAFLACNGIEL